MPKILIVEDDAIVAMAMRVHLQRLGYDVVGVAGTGAKALELGELSSPDLVLMDIKLNGEMDGIETTAKLRSIMSVPVIYVTSYTDEEFLERAKITEPFGYLVKPFQEQELRIAVEVALFKAETEKRLRESERKYRELAELMPQTLFELTRDGSFTFLNRAGLRSIGYSEKELIGGLKASDIVVPEERDRLPGFMAEIQAGETVHDRPLTLLRKDGSRFPSLVYGAPIIRDQEFIGIRGIGIDVTERKEAETALAEAKETWERTFDAVPDLLMILDTNRRVVQMNRAAEKRLGITKEEAGGRLCFDIFHGSSRPHPSCPSPDYFFCGREYEGEVEEARLGGAYHVTISPIYRSGGRPLGTVHVARDVTERKRYEQALEQLVEEIRQFAYIVSHDLRAPLRNIRGFAQELDAQFEEINAIMGMAADHLPAGEAVPDLTLLRQGILESLGFIGSSVSRMDQLIGAILRFSRVGYQELSPVELNTRELVEEALTLFAHRIANEGITVTVSDLPNIVADRSSAQQIFENLISNAINYLDTHRPGEIIITGATIGDEVLFQVTDNGIGIEKSHLGHIFDIFQRIGDKDIPGEGMGLAHVRTLVRRHGGRIWCESEPGRGSSFMFTIPCRLPSTR